jgi:hypothetical protein
MPIDKFPGPMGGTITVFQRKVAFGGFRPVWGIAHRVGLPDGARTSTQPVTYLKTFAARAVEAELIFEIAGTTGQRITVLVNLDEVSDFTLADEKVRPFHQKIKLEKGENDIVLKYGSNNPVVFNRLLVVPALLHD